VRFLFSSFFPITKIIMPVSIHRSHLFTSHVRSLVMPIIPFISHYLAATDEPYAILQQPDHRLASVIIQPSYQLMHPAIGSGPLPSSTKLTSYARNCPSSAQLIMHHFIFHSFTSQL
jgi:hypothetical protein